MKPWNTVNDLLIESFNHKKNFEDSAAKLQKNILDNSKCVTEFWLLLAVVFTREKKKP